MMTQRAHYDLSWRRIAEANEVFVFEILPTLTRAELAALIAKRPHVYGRFAGYLERLP